MSCFLCRQKMSGHANADGGDLPGLWHPVSQAGAGQRNDLQRHVPNIILFFVSCEVALKDIDKLIEEQYEEYVKTKN